MRKYKELPPAVDRYGDGVQFDWGVAKVMAFVAVLCVVVGLFDWIF